MLARVKRMGSASLRCGGPPAARTCALALAGLAGGCGTSVQELLRADAEMSWQADLVMAGADARDPALAEPLAAAEEEKIEACQPITDAVQQRIRGAEEEDFADTVLTGIGELVTWALPVGPPEDCAEAQERYRQSIVDLERRLEAMDNSG